MEKELEKLISECCICHDWKDDKGQYYTPTTEERRKAYEEHTNLSHGFCNPCYLVWEKRELE